MVLGINIQAQSPNLLNYQAVIRDSAQKLLTNKDIMIRISIIHESSTGALVFSETQSTTSNNNGLITLRIGEGQTLEGSISAIDWSKGPYFLKTEIDPSGETNYSLNGISQILSIPYAFYAETAEKLKDSIIEKDPVFISTFNLTNAKKGDILQFDGSKWISVTPNYIHKDSLKELLNEELLAQGLFGSLKDIDGNTYKTIKIGNQVWMAENLRTKHLEDGSEIVYAIRNGDWDGPLDPTDTRPIWDTLTIPGYCWYNNDSALNNREYGPLYNWYAANQNVCPVGWRVPNDSDWLELRIYLMNNGYNYDGTTSGNKMGKSLASTSGWSNSIVQGAIGNTDFPEKRNSTGFNAFPAGQRANGFKEIKDMVFFWSSEAYNDTFGSSWVMHYNDVMLVNLFYSTKNAGQSIRCIKD